LHNNSSSVKKLQEFCPLDNLKTTDARLCRHKLHPAPAAEAGFTNIIYTKLYTFPSRKISQIMDAFSTASNKIGNLPWLGAAATAK
jgi:hypothetical protein